MILSRGPLSLRGESRYHGIQSDPLLKNLGLRDHAPTYFNLILATAVEKQLVELSWHGNRVILDSNYMYILEYSTSDMIAMACPYGMLVMGMSL